MADYAFRSLQARQALQVLWEEQGQTAKALARTLSVPLSTVYTELRRGRTGDRLPDQRLEYDAKTGLPIRQIVSEIIVQSESLITINTDDEQEI